MLHNVKEFFQTKHNVKKCEITNPRDIFLS